MRGRKPIPTALKLIRGNTGHRPIPQDEMTLPAKVPPCPRYLKGEARKEWARLTKVLAGMVTEADRGALAMLCTCWGRFVEAEEQLKIGGLMTKSVKHNDMQSLWLGISNRALEMHCKLCLEFGLTPSSRTRIRTGNLPQPTAAASEWSKFNA